MRARATGAGRWMALASPCVRVFPVACAARPPAVQFPVAGVGAAAAVWANDETSPLPASHPIKESKGDRAEKHQRKRERKSNLEPFDKGASVAAFVCVGCGIGQGGVAQASAGRLEPAALFAVFGAGVLDGAQSPAQFLVQIGRRSEERRVGEEC